MPLINFKTNLTTLKYGLDQPGGGYSGQPYMQFPIEDANTPTSIKNLYEANRYGLDFPIRGGAITQLIQGEFGAITSTVDRERIQKFFKDAPRGTAFIQKQTGLQLTNPRTQVANSLAFAGASLGNAVLPVTNVYNPLNTLAQVQVQGTGAHFNRHGVAPTLYQPLQQTYQYIAGDPQNNTEVTNRLTILKALKLLNNTNFLINSDTLTGVGIDPLLVDRLGISTIQNQLFNYPGGPGSVYGLGFTRIFRYTNTDVTDNSQTNPDPLFMANGVIAQPYSAIAFTYQQIADYSTRDAGDSPVQARIRDFRKQLPEGSPRSNYPATSLVNRLNIGSPGAPNARASYNLYGSGVGVDALNALNPFYFNPNTTDPWTQAGSDSNDIIKFAFECIDNNNVENSVGLIFRAFLEGQIQDSNQAEYNTFKYLGRGETFRTYQGFDRTIGFTFRVFTQSRQEMLPLYKKVNQLISQVYPDYSPNYNLMRGNVVRLTIGDYIYRMPGFLENVNVTIDNSNTPWEILLGEYIEDDVRQLPHMVTIQCTFKPIMDILPRKESYANPFVPLIANKDTYLNPNVPTAPANFGRVQEETVSSQRQQTGVFNPPTILTGRPVNPDPATTATATQFVAPLIPAPTAPFTPLFPATTSARNNRFLFLSNP